MRWQVLTAMITLAAMQSGAAMGSGKTALADPRPSPEPSPVVSVQMSGDELVVKTSEKTASFDGKYKGSNGSSILFDDGVATEFVDRDGRKVKIEKIKIEDGKIILISPKASNMGLGDGKYERQGDPKPQPRDPEPQPRPNPNAFEVHHGKISKIWI